MQVSNDILNELKTLAPLVAGVEKVNVFAVPVGYFDVLAINTLIAVKEHFSDNIQIASLPAVADVPQGYFEDLANNILAKVRVQEEIDARTAADELKALSPLLYNIQDHNVFKVSHNYFHNLPVATLHKINNASVADELKILSPLLLGIQNENVFEAPQGYFDTLASNMLTNAQPQQVRLVSMGKRNSSFIKYAAAAVFIGIIAFTVFKLTGNGTKTVDPVLADATKIIKNKTFDQEMAKLTDVDIISYLQADDNDLEIATLAKSIDEKTLPSQDDYLLDEKTLEDYLNGIN